jgi:iron complex outermembrane recepter protein
MRKCLLLTVLLAGAYLALAQTRAITGVITDAQNQPLPGATVQVQNQKITTLTDADGKFSLNVPTGKVTLEISYVGYKKQTLTVNPTENSVAIKLEPGEGQMGEVVITALGILRDKRSIGYSTSTVKGEELTQAGVTLNPALALYGKAPGVGINIGSAGPTGGVNIRIRGAAGLESFAKTRPLFIVDGVPIYDNASSQANTTYDPLNSLDYGSGINDVNPDDIESIEILKGAKATVLYGSQALNGVVLITTKSGKKTKGLGVNVSHQISVEKPFSYIDFQNEYGSGNSILDTATTVLPNGQRVRTLRANRLSFGPKFDGSQVMRYDSVMVPYAAYPNNWIDFFRTGSSNRTNVAISGGGAFGSARASFSHVDYRDILDRSNQKNNTFSFNGDFNVSQFAKFEFTNNIYSITTQNRRPNLEQVVAWGLNRDYDYNWLRGFYLDASGYRRILDNYALPPSATRLIGVLWEQNNNTDVDKRFHTINSLKTTLQFTKQISLLAQAAVDYTNVDYTTENQIVQLIPQTTGGRFQWRKQNTVVQNYQALLNYDQNFINNNLKIFAYGGWAYQQVNETNVFAGTGENGLRFPDWYSIGNDLLTSGDLSKVRGIVRGSDLIYGILGSVTASWKSTIYLQIDARKDWNSTLPPSHNSYFYPGASLVYNFTDNISIPKLKYGKLSFSWADVGGGPNIALQNRYFADNSYTVQSVYEGASIIGVFPPNSLFIGDIKPFRKREFEVGLNTRWFDQSRIEAELAFYTNNIYNQIIPLNINPATGYSVANINSGNVKNWGYEVSVKGSPFVNKNYRWNLTLTAARQLSKVIKLYEGINEQLVDGINNAVRVVGKVGNPLGDIYMYDFARDPQGNKIVSGNGLYSLDNSKYIKVGNINPKLFGGLYSDFFLKGFNFHIGIDYKYGGKIFSYSNQYLTGNGVIKSTLPGRDEAHGGLAYYIEQGTNNRIPWQHNQPAPANAVGGIVYHDGMILPGVKAVVSGGTTKYVINDIIVSAPAYYQTYISDVSTGWPPDRMYDNNYIKLREISLDYTIPKRISEKLHLQKLSVNAAVRNLGYIYKSIPNIDPESTLSSQGFVEDSFYPSIRSFILGLNISF